MKSSETHSGKLQFSSLRLILFNSIVCGLEFCASAGFTYIPPLLLKAGISEQWMGITLGVGPFLGFVFVPFLGQASDRMSASAPLGKRKPFILALCCLLFLSLIAIPHFGHFVHSRLTAEQERKGVEVAEAAASPLGLATFCLCLSVVLFDFSSQVCLSPCEALLSDISSPTHQNDQAFNAYSFMVSFGGCVGYFLSSINWKSSYVSSFFSPDATQELISFSILTVLFLITVILTFVTTKESAVSMYRNQKNDSDVLPLPSSFCAPSLDDVGSSCSSASSPHFIGGQLNGHLSSNQSTLSPRTKTLNGDVAAISASAAKKPPTSIEIPPHISSSPPPPSPTLFPRCLLLLAPSLRAFRIRRWFWKTYHRFCPSSSSSFSKFRFLSCSSSSSIFRFPLSLFSNLSSFLRRRLRISAVHLPPILVPLMTSHFFSWSAMMAIHIFYTDFVGRAIMSGDPNASADSPEFARYDLGIRIGSQGLFLNALVSMTFSLIMDRLLLRISPRGIWTCTLYLFVLATAVMMLTNNVTLHYLLIGATGTFYAVINALPIALINEYHEDQQLYFGPKRTSSNITCNINNNNSKNINDDESMLTLSDISSDTPLRNRSVPEVSVPLTPVVEKRGIGTDMALLDSAYFLSQVFITSSLGYLSYWTESVYVYIIFANVSALLSILTLGGVVFNPSDMAAAG